MKKIMAVLAALMLVLPFTGVNAATTIDGSVREYQVGDIVNFYRSAEEKANNTDNKAGQKTIVLSTEKVDGKYIKVLAIASYLTSDLYFDSNIESTPTSITRKKHIGYINEHSTYPWESAKDLDATLTYVTLDELKSAFGATYDDSTDTYVIDATKWADTFELAAINSSISKGFYTSTYDIENNYVWAVTYEWDSTGNEITGIVVKKVAMDSNDYDYLPVVYFDETYDCHYVESQDQYACYSCGENYEWLEVGKQAETCTLVENITAKSKCSKNPETGIEEYALELAGIVAVCAVALVIVKRKELFRGI